MAIHAHKETQDVRLETIAGHGQVDVETSRREAVLAAMFAIGWPGGFTMLLVAFAGMASYTDPVWLLIGMLHGMLVGVGVIQIAGYSIGWFAHYWFYQTKTPPKRMATVMALILDGVIFGWVLVFVFRQTAKW